MKIAKTTLLLAGASLFLSAGISLSQAQSVSTDPVGYLSTEIPAHSGGSSTVFLLNLPMLPAADFSSSITSVSGSTINFAVSSIADGDFVSLDSNGLPLYYVEFTSGSEVEGLTIGITGNTSSSITITDDLSALLSGNETFNVRKFSTLADVFGSDNSLYSLTSAGNANDADVIYLEDNAGNLDRYYYQSAPPFAGGSGWRVAGNTSTDMSNTRINWNAVLISRNGAASRDAISFVGSGTVKIGSAKTVITDGLNLVGFQYPVATTIGSIGLDPADLLQGANANVADVVYVLDSSTLERFYYQSAPPFAGGSGWRKAGDTSTDQSGFAIGAESAVLILKRGGDPIYLSSDQPFTL